MGSFLGSRRKPQVSRETQTCSAKPQGTPEASRHVDTSEVDFMIQTLWRVPLKQDKPNIVGRLLALFVLASKLGFPKVSHPLDGL